MKNPLLICRIKLIISALILCTGYALPSSLFQPRLPKGLTKASFIGAQENQQ